MTCVPFGQDVVCYPGFPSLQVCVHLHCTTIAALHNACYVNEGHRFKVCRNLEYNYVRENAHQLYIMELLNVGGGGGGPERESWRQ